MYPYPFITLCIINVLNLRGLIHGLYCREPPVIQTTNVASQMKVSFCKRKLVGTEGGRVAYIIPIPLELSFFVFYHSPPPDKGFKGFEAPFNVIAIEYNLPTIYKV